MKYSRRHFLITSLAAVIVGCRQRETAEAATAEESTPPLPKTDLSIGGIWQGIGFGTSISAEMWGLSEVQGDALMKRIEKTISHLEHCFSLYLEQSELRILNREGSLQQPSHTFIHILEKAQRLSEATLGYTQPAVHHIWQIVQQKLDQAENPKNIDWSEISTLNDHWEAASMKHVKISDDEIKLTHPHTQLSLNAIGQGYATDVVAKMLLQAGVTSAKIDCGETYCIGKHPENRPWTLGVIANNDLLSYIELTDAGLAVSSSAPDKILLDPINHCIVPNRSTTAITSSAGACTADAFATAFAIAPKKQHSTLRKNLEFFGNAEAHVW